MKQDLIKNYINDLNSKNPSTIILFAIEQLVKINISEIKYLIMPLSKSHWDGAAEVLLRIDNKKLNNFVSELFSWLEDINWPGSYKIVKKLSLLKYDKLKPVIISRIITAIKDNDDEILYSIQLLLREILVNNKNIIFDDVFVNTVFNSDIDVVLNELRKINLQSPL